MQDLELDVTANCPGHYHTAHQFPGAKTFIFHLEATHTYDYRPSIPKYN